MTLKKNMDAIMNHITNMITNTNANVMTLVTMMTNLVGYVSIGYVCQSQITVHHSSSKIRHRQN